MMTIQFNQKQLTLEKNMTLAEALTRQGYTDTYFAVSINKQFVPRAQYAQTVLVENDVLDIILPMQGG